MRDPRLIEFAKQMRRDPTEAEKRIWFALRAKRFEGVKFRFQKVIGRYVADFSSRDPMFVIEIDGDTQAVQQAYDAERSAYFESLGYRMIRFTNADVRSNLEGVLTSLQLMLRTPPSPNPLPRRGEGFVTRLSTAFSRAPALICFVTAGDGDTRAILDALVAGGANIIELGMPFTDPMADGPAIQAANLRSLAAGTTTADILRIAKDFRARHPEIPLVLMGYANPMLRRGADWFAAAAKDAGVDGIICVDIPPEEDDALGPALRDAGIATIRLATPTTDAARLPQVLDGASGFLYYVSVAGITGLQQAAQDSIDTAVAKLKAATDLPVAVGFGIRTPEQAAAVARVADGVVVGSAIVELVGKHGVDAPAPVRAYIETLASAVRTARKQIA